MRKFMTLLGAAVLLLALSGSANAGYWSVDYDLTGSIAVTNSPGGVKSDPVTGTWRFEFDSLSEPAPAPYSGARMAAGTQHVTLSQVFTPTLSMTLTGTSNVQLLPVAGGQPVVISGANLNAFTVPDSNTDGYNHCFGAVICVLAGFPGSSIPQPLTPPPGTIPWAVPKVKFGATAGVGSFTSDPKTDIVGYTTTGPGTVPQTFIVSNYVGTEVSRYYITGAVPALGGGALLGLAAFLLIGGTSTLALRNRRS